MKYLEISYCNKLQSLPEGIQKLRCLQSLHILCCYRFASFQMFGFGGLSSLRKLWIEKCEAFCSLSEGIQYLTALEELCLDKCPKLISLPEGIQHLTNLRTLQIWNCDRLSALPTQIGCLTSLSYLAIEYCSSLMSIPDEMQNLRTLKTLLIRECPHLKRRCKKGSGVDWHKIAHIPNIQTYFWRPWDFWEVFWKLRFCYVIQGWTHIGTTLLPFCERNLFLLPFFEWWIELAAFLSLYSYFYFPPKRGYFFVH